MINVLGDVGLVLGTFFIFRHTHTLDLLASFRVAPHVFASGGGDVTAGCLLLLVGAFAKSAQIPLHTWLPDAMEGPTPVSALIHAATMVTAGVYLIARMHPLFQLAPAAGDVGAIIGALTLLIAGTIGLAATDLKRVIAYSTMSQIGYMIMGVSVGAYTAGLFHLMTHAFFKALLFMAAGSLISGDGRRQSLDRMSGLRRALPFTFGCFIVGGLALSGVPPFSGFFSKDSILLFVAGPRRLALGAVRRRLRRRAPDRALHLPDDLPRVPGRALPGGDGADRARAPASTPSSRPTPPTARSRTPTSASPAPTTRSPSASWPMRAAMCVLALLAIVGGIVAIPQDDELARALPRPHLRRLDAGQQPLQRPARGRADPRRGRGVGGIAIAYYVWVKRPGARDRRSRALRADSTTLFENKWYFDELIDALVVRPGAWFGRFAQNSFERLFVNGALIGGSDRARARAGSALVRAQRRAGCCASTPR